MKKIFSLDSLKGGTGKSLVGTALVDVALSAGKKVLIVEVDMSVYTSGQRVRDSVLYALGRRGLVLVDHLMPLYQLADIIAKLDGLDPPEKTFAQSFLERWLVQEKVTLGRATLRESAPFKPLENYNLLANIPPDRDYRKYPSIICGRRVWRDGRREAV